MRSTLLCSFLLLLALSLVGCGGDDKASQGPLDAGTPTGTGIVQSARGTAKRAEGLPEGKGTLKLELSHTDRLINQKVRLVLTDAEGIEVGSGEGNELFPLMPGTYGCRIEYAESEQVAKFEGTVAGLVVHAGAASEYQIAVSAPIGILRMRFSDGKENVSEKVRVSVYKSADDPELVLAPIFEGEAGANIVLPAESYQVKAVFTPSKGFPITEWYKDIVVAEAMARTEREIVLELDVTGLRVDAFNFGRDVNSRTRVYMYAEGADVNFAVAKFQGKAGEAIPADPGTYDVRVVYTPSDSALDFFGDRTVTAIRVHRGLGTRLQLDVEKPMAMVRLVVKDGDLDVSDKAELRVMRAGADVDAASPVVDEIGVGQHPVPVGVYDIYVKAATGSEAARSRSFRGVNLGNGFVWEQTFNAAVEAWTAGEVRKPTGELRAVDWRPPGDDDDSGKGDDDDSAGTPATPAPPTPAPSTP